MQYSKVEICGVNTAKLKVLKESEKLELLKKSHSGDKRAREQRHYLRQLTCHNDQL